jgi:diamine N-acetyltransferase
MPPDVSLEEITAETLQAVLDLDVAPDQQDYVASNAVSIAQAHFNAGAWFRAVTSGGRPVGFVMLFDPTIPGALADEPIEQTDMGLWRLMIDRRFQRQGFGRRTLDLVRTHIAGLGRNRLLSSCVPGASGPERFYLSYGFIKTGGLCTGGKEIEIALPL